MVSIFTAWSVICLCLITIYEYLSRSNLVSYPMIIKSVLALSDINIICEKRVDDINFSFTCKSYRVNISFLNGVDCNCTIKSESIANILSSLNISVDNLYSFSDYNSCFNPY